MPTSRRHCATLQDSAHPSLVKLLVWHLWQHPQRFKRHHQPLPMASRTYLAHPHMVLHSNNLVEALHTPPGWWQSFLLMLGASNSILRVTCCITHDILQVHPLRETLDRVLDKFLPTPTPTTIHMFHWELARVSHIGSLLPRVTLALWAVGTSEGPTTSYRQG
jgi:hypothetical protein